MLLDTQKLVERLKDAGVPPDQARAHIVVLTDALSEVEMPLIKRVESKQDFAPLVAQMSADSSILESRIKVALINSKIELICWIAGVAVLQMLLIVALVFKLAT